MTYEPKPGVLTEEDKARLVLGNTGHDVDVAEILDTVFTAVEKGLEDAKEEIEDKFETEDENGEPLPDSEIAIPRTAELSQDQKEAAETREATHAEMCANPDEGGPSSHIEGNEDAGETNQVGDESAHASETNIGSDESDDAEGSDEPLADPVENKTVEPDAGKDFAAPEPELNPEPSTDEPSTSVSADADAPELSTESTPSSHEGTDSVTDGEGTDEASATESTDSSTGIV